MKTKLDCVEMKHRGAEKIQEQIADMTLAKELKFWQEGTRTLRKKKEQLMKKQRVIAVNP